jgi:hypothetical protein
MYAQELDIRYTPYWILAPHDIDLFGWQDNAYLAYIWISIAACGMIRLKY